MINEHKKVENISEHIMEELESLDYCDHIEPPFWGTSNLLTWSGDTVFQSIKQQELFKGEWSAPDLGIDNLPGNLNDPEALYQQLKDEVIQSELLQGAGIYGFFPVITDNELLVILDPSDFHTELMTLQFPRSDTLKGRSVCDFFRPTGDSVAIQAGTIGPGTQLCWQSYLQDTTTRTRGEYLRALAEHCSKIITDKITTEIRRCQGLERGIGVVYDLTGPAMPLPDSRKKIFEFLSLEERLGIELSEQFEITPQHSTVGIFVHHPLAGTIS